jgi:hypothetical protein
LWKDMMGEDAYRSRARQLGAVSLLLFAIGVLVLAIGAVVGLSVLLSIFPFGLLPVPEAARIVAGSALIIIGDVFSLLFALYAGFKGRGVVSRPDLSGWELVVKNLGRLYFIATLFVSVGILVIPGTSPIYVSTVLILVSAVLLMVSAHLTPSPQQSMAAGIVLIVASIASLIGVGAGAAGALGMLQVATALPATYGLLPAIALMIVGVALILRAAVAQRFISHIVAGVGGIVFAAGLAYVHLSTVAVLSQLSSPLTVIQALRFLVPQRTAGLVEVASWTLYGTGIAGSSLIGIAGILGLVALILAITFAAKSALPAAPQQPAGPRQLNYCPGCGSPVSPEDNFCGSCGRRLR